MKHFLTVIVPDKKAVKYALKGDIITIGRGKDNAISLDITAVSSNHLEIRKTEFGYQIIDLNSTNGTTVNGERISEHDLSNGDELIIGTAIRAQYAAAADESTAATAPAAALPPKTIAPPTHPATPTVILKKAPSPTAAPTPAQTADAEPPSEIRIRKMTPPGVEEPDGEAASEPSPPNPATADPPAQPEPEAEPETPPSASKLNVPNPVQQGAGPKKLNLG